MATVTRLREPFGLPEFPEANWPSVFLPFFICDNITHTTLNYSTELQERLHHLDFYQFSFYRRHMLTL